MKQVHTQLRFENSKFIEASSSHYHATILNVSGRGCYETEERVQLIIFHLNELQSIELLSEFLILSVFFVQPSMPEGRGEPYTSNGSIQVEIDDDALRLKVCGSAGTAINKLRFYCSISINHFFYTYLVSIGMCIKWIFTHIGIIITII